jgi:hypothetical protein
VASYTAGEGSYQSKRVRYIMVIWMVKSVDKKYLDKGTTITYYRIRWNKGMWHCEISEDNKSWEDYFDFDEDKSSPVEFDDMLEWASQPQEREFLIA